jgi:hypothetical protein
MHIHIELEGVLWEWQGMNFLILIILTIFDNNIELRIESM